MSVLIQEPEKKAQAAILWMHGLGADATDMIALADQLALGQLPLRHLFLNAPLRPVTLNAGMVMPAWFDILGRELQDREDREGVQQSEQLIRQVMADQLKDGLESSQIFLAGFSQGGAMALYTALHTQDRLAGVIALSAYLPLHTQVHPKLEKHCPFFMGAGQFDPLVLPKWSEKSRDWLLSQGYEQVTYHEYPMEHAICFEEIKDLGLWISRHVQGVLQ